MVSGEISLASSSIPASALSALSNIAEEAPSNELVFPVITRPSASSIAAAGSPSVSAFILAAATTGLSAIDTPAFFIRSSSFNICSSSAAPCLFKQSA